MSAFAIVRTVSLAPLIALTLLHFLWQGAALAGLLALALSTMRRQSAVRRYAVAVTALALMACAPLVTGMVLVHSAGDAHERHRTRVTVPTSVAGSWTAQTGGKQNGGIRVTDENGSMAPWIERVTAHADLIVALWIVGVALLSLRTLGGWLLGRKVAFQEMPEYESLVGSLQEALKRVATRLGILRLPELRISNKAQGPFLFGALRPVIVLPVGAVIGLSPAMLETILAHELAHIVRHDYLVNMVQCLVETVLFYHPAVWWVSHRVRDERETCCDDRVVACLEDRLTYARALTGLEELRAQNFAVAATGGSLTARIERILGVKTVDTNRTHPFATGICALLLAVTLAIGMHAAAQSQHNSSERDRTDASPAPLLPPKEGGGSIPVEGSGIEITLKDSTRQLRAGQEPNELLIHDSDLQHLMHALWQAGAHDISLGSQQITPRTTIHAKGPDIVVNDMPVSPPYVVRVLGDSEKLTKQIQAEGGTIDRLVQIDPAMVTIKTIGAKQHFDIHVRVIRCEMSAEGIATETVVSTPRMLDVEGMPATMSNRTVSATGKEIESTEIKVIPVPAGQQRVRLKASLKIREVGGKPMEAQTKPDFTIEYGKNVRILGVIATSDAQLKRAVESGQVVKDHGAYHASYLEIKVD